MMRLTWKRKIIIWINDLKSSGSECDVILEIDFFATYDDFEDDFVGADFVQEIVKKHLEAHEAMTMIITEDNYPNEYDITIMPKEGE